MKRRKASGSIPKGGSPPGGGRAHVREPGASVRGAVLVVDDQAAQRLLVTTVLESMAGERDVLVREAPTAVRALAVLEGLPPELPVLVLTDAVMPGMNGLALVKTARQNFRDRRVRYVLFTAHEGEHFSDVRAEFGIDAVATKPVGIDALRGVLREQLDDWLRMG